MQITLVNHPLAASRLTIMRDSRSDNTVFRAALADLGTMLIYEASRDLPVEHFATIVCVCVCWWGICHNQVYV